MILIDLVKVLIYGQKSEAAIIDYLEAKGYDKNVVADKIAALHPYPYGTCFTSKYWYKTIKAEDKFYNKIIRMIARTVDASNKSLERELRQFVPYRLRHMYEDTIEGLKRLSAIDDIILCSNSHASTKRLVDEFGISQYLRGMVLSCDIGVAKPDKEFFEIVLNRYNLEPAECVFVDDKIDNIKTAQSMGMTTYMMDRTSASGDVNSLNDLADKLLAARDSWQIKSSNQSAKNTYGIIAIDGVDRFYKQFDNEVDYVTELTHYRAVKDVLQVPHLVACDRKKRLLVYEEVKDISVKTLHYRLYNDGTADYNYLNYGYDRLSLVRARDCINSKFFYDRIHKIDECLENLPILQKSFVINGKQYNLAKIMRDIKCRLSQNRRVPSVISQGDPIDLNILSCGKVIDLETAGRNSLVGDVAILINNLMINGYYFFIKYAKSDYRNYMADYEKNKDAVYVNYDIQSDKVVVNINLHIPNCNKKYLLGLMDKLRTMYSRSVLRQVDRDLPYYLAFRMITPKNVLEMEEADQIAALCLMAISYDMGTLEGIKNYLVNILS